VAFVALFLLARPAAGQVVGDCNEDGCVQIGELIVAIKIVLGDTQLSACPAFADCLIAHDSGGIGCLTEAVDNDLSCFANHSDGPLAGRRETARGIARTTGPAAI